MKLKSYSHRGSSLSIKYWLGAMGIVLGFGVSAGVHAETIAGIDFDDNAFVDTVVSSSGIFGPTVWFTATVGASDSSAIIGSNINNFAHSLTLGAYIEIGFEDNAIVNGPGDDLGIFELGVILEPQFFTLTVADMLASANVVQVNTSFTGFTNNLGVNINYGTLDLSDLGVPLGATVKSLVFTSICDASTETTTGGACTAGDQAMAAPVVIAAINSVSGLDPLSNYDNFNARKYNGCKNCINSEKWIGFQRGDHNTEVLREIKSKRLHMSQRTWGDTDSDEGTVQGRNRMRFRDSVNYSGACFTPRIKKYELKNCAANPDHGHTRIRIVGNFFDTGVADDADVGVVYGWIELIRHGDTGDKKGLFGIHGYADECLNADCTMDNWSTYDGTDDPDLDFGEVRASKNKKALCIGYDRANHQLVFSYGNDVRTVTTADHGLPAFANNLAASQTWYVIDTRNDVENCTAGPITGFVDVDVDNVKIREYQ